MNVVLGIILSLSVFVLILIVIFRKKKKHRKNIPLSASAKELLNDYVDFYKDLNAIDKEEFERRMQHFLSTVKIAGVKNDVEELDRVLIAASAIIPIFGFKNWEYFNLKQVLLYPESFNERFDLEGEERTTLGLVGTGPYQNMMLLSKHELRQGFINKESTNNTAIHEFVHLIDKTDGAVDGIPENLVSKQYAIPWLKLMQRKINEILQNRSDINPYGATNEAEFFAVVSEYFFERPDLLQEKHPELYELLKIIFQQQPLENKEVN